MSVEGLIQDKTAQAAEMLGFDLTKEELEELAYLVWDLLKQELNEENARLGKLF